MAVYVTAKLWATTVLPLADKSACLPYPETGGRQQHLIISCKPWLLAFTSLSDDMLFKCTTVVEPGFMLVHKLQKTGKPL